MPMIESIAIAVVAITGAYFVALGLGSLFVPGKAANFLLGFAATPRLHYVELLTRVLVGMAFIVSAHRLPAHLVFSVFGWVLLSTSALLFLVPWRWHHRFAGKVVPVANRYITAIGLSSLVFGVHILASVASGIAATAM